MESTLNNTVVPLLSGRIYIGTWEKSLYNSAVVTVLADTTTELICYQSLNKVQTQTTTFQTQAGRYFTYNINLNLPYVYFTVRNNSATNQALLNFGVIYKNIPDNNKGTLKIWNNSASTGVNGFSSPIFLNQNSANMTFFGNVNGGTTLTFQISNDNINYYDSQYSLTASSAQDFGFSIPASSIFYARLKSSSDVTITAYANYS